jgi:hypothetical protein
MKFNTFFNYKSRKEISEALAVFVTLLLKKVTTSLFYTAVIGILK